MKARWHAQQPAEESAKKGHVVPKRRRPQQLHFKHACSAATANIISSDAFPHFSATIGREINQYQLSQDERNTEGVRECQNQAPVAVNVDLKWSSSNMTQNTKGLQE